VERVQTSGHDPRRTTVKRRYNHGW
jgi:hypothetical protein